MTSLSQKIAILKKVITKIEQLDYSVNNVARYNVVKQQLAQRILECRDRGVAEGGDPDKGLIVSLTTHGLRIHSVSYAIESLFAQTLKPDRVVLYLGEAEFAKQQLPISLMRQVDRGLDLRYVADIGPHTKLIPALREFPEATIITVDDDYMYSMDLIERLVRVHESHPGAVCCGSSVVMKKAKDGRLMPYKTYPFCYSDTDFESHSLLAEGFGGALYPPHIFPDTVFDVALLQELAPRADDLWFKAMELLAGIPVVQMARNRYWFNSVTKEINVQVDGLRHYNLEGEGNDEQLRKLFSHFNLYDKLP